MRSDRTSARTASSKRPSLALSRSFIRAGVSLPNAIVQYHRHNLTV